MNTASSRKEVIVTTTQVGPHEVKLAQSFGNPEGEWGLIWHKTFIQVAGRGPEHESDARQVLQRMTAEPERFLHILAEAFYDSTVRHNPVPFWRWRGRKSEAAYKRCVEQVIRKHYPEVAEVSCYKQYAEVRFCREGKSERMRVSFAERPNKNSIRFLGLWRQTRQSTRTLWVRYYRLRFSQIKDRS